MSGAAVRGGSGARRADAVRRADEAGRPAGTRRPAFSLIELLVVVAVAVILFSIFVPYVGKMRELDRRASCANNLRGLHAALSVYAANHGRDFPRSTSDPAAPPHYVTFTGAAGPTTTAASASATTPTHAPAPAAAATTVPAGPPPGTGAPPTPGLAATPPQPTDPPTATPGPATAPVPATGPAAAAAGTGGPAPNDVTAALWLLVRLGHVGPDAFVCPSGDESVDPMRAGGQPVPAAQRFNFTGPKHLSYSYAYPFLDVNGKPQLNSDRLPPDFPILADKNPGPPAGGTTAGPAYDAPPLALAAGNSPNHGRAGQNVLYVTGEVRFQKTPYCGYAPPKSDPMTTVRDNLYTAYGRSRPPAGAVPADLQTPGVRGRDVGPAWAYDAYLVPAAGE